MICFTSLLLTLMMDRDGYCQHATIKMHGAVLKVLPQCICVTMLRTNSLTEVRHGITLCLAIFFKLLWRDIIMLDELQKVMDRRIARAKELARARAIDKRQERRDTFKCKGQEGVCYCPSCMNAWSRTHELA